MGILKDKYNLNLEYKTFVDYIKYESNNKLVCFGASLFGERLLEKLTNDKIVIEYFCDNNESKWGKKLGDVEIISPQQLYKISNVDILITSEYVGAINYQLKEAGMKNIFFVKDANSDRKVIIDKARTILPSIKNMTLIIVNDNIGDSLIRINLLERYIEFFGKKNIYFLVSKSSYNVLKMISDNLIIIDSERLKCDEEYLSALILNINELGIKNIIATTHCNVYNRIDALINNIDYINVFYNHDNDSDTYILKPQVDLYNFVTKSNLKVGDVKPSLNKYLVETKSMITGRYIAIGMGATDKGRMLEEKKLSNIIKFLLQSGNKVILLGNGDSDFEYYTNVLECIDTNENIVNLVNKTKLQESLNIIKNSQLFIGVDSALYHAAYALNVPSVIIIGGGHFEKFRHKCEYISYIFKKMDCFSCGWGCIYGDIKEHSAECIKKIDIKIIENELLKHLNLS